MFILDLDLLAQRVPDPTPESRELASWLFTSVKMLFLIFFFFFRLLVLLRETGGLTVVSYLGLQNHR